jgi:hypothetical protein
MFFNSDSNVISKGMLSADSGNISGGKIARQNLGMFYRPTKEGLKL